MEKRRILIYGANTTGLKLARRIDASFDVAGFIERECAVRESLPQDLVCYANIRDVPGSVLEKIDFIFSIVDDFNGLQREYIKAGVPFEKIMDVQHVHQYSKYVLHQTLSNEIIYRQVPGSVAELGVDFGDTAKYINFYFPDRKLYLFDTFKGFDMRDKEPTQVRTAAHLEYYNIRSNPGEVLERMFYPESCIVKKDIFLTLWMVWRTGSPLSILIVIYIIQLWRDLNTSIHG